MNNAGNMDSIDNVDKILIKSLSENARISLNNLSKNVYLSAPAVSSRLSKLEEQGVIKEYKAIIDYEKLGYIITAFIDVAMEPEMKPDFFSFVNSCRNVLECYNIAGAYSMLIKVAFKKTQDLETFVTKLQKFGKTQTQIVFSILIDNRNPDL